MKRHLVSILPGYFGTHVQLKKTNDILSNLLVDVRRILMQDTGVRKKYSKLFFGEENVCSIEEIMSDIVSNTYKNIEVFYLLKTKEGELFILRHFKSRKIPFYFCINIMPKEEFNKDKILPEAVFFYKKK